ncbi:MAG: hypothetical protein VX618_00085 [Thermodesulfobacteriota bacterium]|nr:hypothetical protein [bacterium]MEC7924883.1 hypothetical protein [Thermodesulfobacteriota bacterium]|tara:strand:- start:577 stop:879 length:303 start_codon:yes stop_codon:yes gene_type:complete
MSDNYIFSLLEEVISRSNLKLTEELKAIYKIKYNELRIDLQDVSLLETISDDEKNEIVDKILKKLESVDKDQKVIDVFFHEVTETIDYVYNLIISKQLGG